MKNLAKKVFNRFDSRRIFLRSLPESAIVLDLGCGGGGNGAILKTIQPTVELQGVDLYLDSDLPSFYRFKKLDLECGVLPFQDNFFDAVLFTNVIEHLHSPLQLGREINRVMKKGARIYIETANWTTVFIPSFGFHREQHGPINFYDDHTHIKPWSKHGLYEFLSQSCGLRVAKIGNTRNWVRLPFDCLITLYGLFRGKRAYVVSSFWNVFGWIIYGVAVKD